MRKNSGRSTAFVSSGQGEQGFWPSYADMMSAVALILFFLMLLSYIQNLITGNDLQNTQDLLADTRVQLVHTEDQVKAAEKELGLITVDLDTAKEELLRQQGFIAEQQDRIDQQNASIEQQKQSIQEQNAIIASQKQQAAKQEKYLASTQKELTEMRSQMQTIAVLRLSILEQIKDSISKVMGSNAKVTIGDNGTIILSESILFDFGSSEVRPASAQMLNQLSNVFVTFLSDNENAKYVDSIVISGHTDNLGSDEGNRTLSTDRANSVLAYLLKANNGKLNPYAKYFCSAGYGTTRPVATNSTEAGRAANRRIEISMILKDETVLDIVEQYLAIEMPGDSATPAANN